MHGCDPRSGPCGKQFGRWARDRKADRLRPSFDRRKSDPARRALSHIMIVKPPVEYSPSNAHVVRKQLTTLTGSRKSSICSTSKNVNSANMASRGCENKKFVKWLKQWRGAVQSHVSMEQTHSEKKEADSKPMPDSKSIARRKEIIAEETTMTNH